MLSSLCWKERDQWCQAPFSSAQLARVENVNWTWSNPFPNVAATTWCGRSGWGGVVVSGQNNRVGDVGTEFGSVPLKAIMLVTGVVVCWGKPKLSSESTLSPGSNWSRCDGDSDDHGITPMEGCRNWPPTCPRTVYTPQPSCFSAIAAGVQLSPKESHQYPRSRNSGTRQSPPKEDHQASDLTWFAGCGTVKSGFAPVFVRVNNWLSDPHLVAVRRKHLLSAHYPFSNDKACSLRLAPDRYSWWQAITNCGWHKPTSLLLDLAIRKQVLSSVLIFPIQSDEFLIEMLLEPGISYSVVKDTAVNHNPDNDPELRAFFKHWCNLQLMSILSGAAENFHPWDNLQEHPSTVDYSGIGCYPIQLLLYW